MTSQAVRACLLVLVASAARSLCQPPPALSMVQGTAVAADGVTPLPSLLVRLAPQSDTATLRPGQQFLSAETDAAGRFVFERVPEGNYLLAANTLRGVPAGRQTLKLRGTGGATVTLTLEWHRLVRGVVVDPAGRPVPAADVTLSLRARHSSGGLSPVSRLGSLQAQTTAAGQLLAVAPFPPVEAELALRVPGVGWLVAGGVDVTPATVDVGVVRLQRGGEINGVLRAADAAEPIAGARVSLYARTQPARACVFGLHAETDDGGRFSIDALPPGDYHVAAAARGFRPVMRRGVSVQAGKAETLVFELKRSAVAPKAQ